MEMPPAFCQIPVYRAGCCRGWRPRQPIRRSDLDGQIFCNLPIFLVFRGIEPLKTRWDAEGVVPYDRPINRNLTTRGKAYMLNTLIGGTIFKHKKRSLCYP